MKQCPNCEAMLVDGAKFCAHCGAVVEVIHQGPRVMFCSNCGTALKGKFCNKCGMPAEKSKSETPVVHPQNDKSGKTPKKKSAAIIFAVIAAVLVLSLGLSWAFGLFGDGLFAEDNARSSSRRDRDDEDDEEKSRDETGETKIIPIIVQHPVLGEVIDGYMEVDITDERDYVYKEYEPSDDDYHTEPTPLPAQPEMITLTVWAPAEDQSEDCQWLQTMCARFEAAHPEYEITWELVGISEADAKSTILTNVGAGADVYMFANDQLGELVEANALAPITGTVLDQVKAGASETMLSTVTYGDDVYGIPYTGNTWWLYYDKSVFSESDIRSLDTMLTKGKVAFRLNNGWYTQAFYLANGCSMFGPNGNDAAAGFDFGGDNAVAVTHYLVDLVNNPNFISDNGENGLAGIEDGTIHAFVSGDWEAQKVKDALGENFGAAQLPTITIDGEAKQLRAFAGSKAIGVNPYSDNLIASYQFAMYLGSAEGQKLRYEMRGVIPCDASLAELVASDPVALAQMNCLNNSAAVQPTIPEMGIWWDNAAALANEIIAGTITHKNAEEKTEAFNDILNNG